VEFIASSPCVSRVDLSVFLGGGFEYVERLRPEPVELAAQR
jgi:hypothetical protein